MNDVAKGEGRTVLFVSHNMAAVKSLCNKGILMQNGEISLISNINNTISEYSLLNKKRSYIHKSKNNSEITFKKIYITNKEGIESYNFSVEDNVLINFDLEINKKNPLISLFVIIKDKYDSPVFSAETKIESNKIVLNIDNTFLTRGNYVLNSFIHIPKVTQLEIAQNVCPFSIIDSSSFLSIHGDYEYGNVFGSYEWNYKNT
jgi:lipopolysaccharide transport system ATP-binding protein